MSIYSLQVSVKARKQLAMLPKKQQILISKWIDKNLADCDNPRSIPGSKPLVGYKDGWRYRVGNYRILVTILDDELVINIIRVGHRQGVYKRN